MRLCARSLTKVGAASLAALLMITSGCRSTGDRTRTQAMSDRSTAKAVKKSLDQAPIFKYPDVKANAYEGTVELTGFVETPEQREQAALVAAHTKGVRQVINQILIRPSPVGRATIRDPLGNETGRIMLDTNAPLPAPLEMTPPAPGSSPPSTGTQPTPPTGTELAPQGTQPGTKP